MFTLDFNKPCRVHFIGIGGISMSGLAEVLAKSGFTVTGSDIKESDITNTLKKYGVKIMIGQVKENISSGIDVVVYTAAISKDNEELNEVIKRNIPLMTRAELLGQIMSFYKNSIAISGTHGKTTTTSMLSHILLEANTDPTISIGGMLDVIDGNIRVGQSDYFITEACEYTNSYHSLYPYIAIILNIDADHLDFFKDIDDIAASFAKFATNVDESGYLIINGDSPYAKMVAASAKCKVITFGEGSENDYIAKDIHLNELGCPEYELIIDGESYGSVTLSTTGVHNAVNSLSAIASSRILGISMDVIRSGLKNCKSAKRRFEYKGRLPKGTVVIDDYAHHPTEIAATLRVAKSICKGEVYVAFQPHTYSRTYALLNDFATALSIADHVVLADIYPAREKDTGLVSSKDVHELILKEGRMSHYLGDFESIKEFVLNSCQQNDMFITMGAGNIDSISNSIAK